MAKKNISQIGEFGFIERLRVGMPQSDDIIRGIGNDTAVIKVSDEGNLLLLTCDTVVEGVHFESSAEPYDVGWKSMAANISDIASMGGLPRYAMVALSAPGSLEIDYLDRLYEGMRAVAGKFGVDLVGGDTTRSPESFVITVSLTGEVESDHLVTRDGARSGQTILVTGKLGGSISGKHLRFMPRVEEARFLVEKFKPAAMIDLSDGLASDIRHITDESKVGARVFAEKIPISPDAEKLADGDPTEALAHALFDGEDFELLLTMEHELADEAMAEFEKRFDLSLTAVGEITSDSGNVVLADHNSTEKELKPHGYDHFKKHN